MKFTLLGARRDIALAVTDERVIADTASALDFLMSAKCETGCEKLALKKECVMDAFFILSTGMAGEILQKFINYHTKLAIVGDYSHYTSKPLHDFIYESNKGNDFFFVETVEEAVEKLERAE